MQVQPRYRYRNRYRNRIKSKSTNFRGLQLPCADKFMLAPSRCTRLRGLPQNYQNLLRYRYRNCSCQASPTDQGALKGDAAKKDQLPNCFKLSRSAGCLPTAQLSLLRDAPNCFSCPALRDARSALLHARHSCTLGTPARSALLHARHLHLGTCTSAPAPRHLHIRTCTHGITIEKIPISNRFHHQKTKPQSQNTTLPTPPNFRGL